MNIEQYVEDLRRQLETAASLGGDEVADAASRLTSALEPATRLTLLDAISEATSEITSEIAPASVDTRLRGKDIDFVVNNPVAREDEDDTDDTASDLADTMPVTYDTDNATRTTLRLPTALKDQAEAAASAAGMSLNTWLVRAVAMSVQGPTTRTAKKTRVQRSNKIQGWMK